MQQLPRDYASIVSRDLTEDQCFEYTAELLEFIAANVTDPNEVRDALIEVISWYADNYLAIQKGDAEKIFSWVQNNWDSDSEDFLEDSLTILANLHPELFPQMRQYLAVQYDGLREDHHQKRYKDFLADVDLIEKKHSKKWSNL